jgi:phage/plasmid-like protein (TIGR03299 family)
MAHEISLNKRKGTYSFASHAEPAWHGLGQILDHPMTSAEAIEQANLDYQVGICPKKAEITLEDGSTIYSPIEDKFATYRKDTNEVLGEVATRYEIVQNKDAFGFFDAIIDSGEAIFETAGSLGKGERIFVTAKLPEDLLVAGEPCNKYIMLTNSHDGSSSIIAGFTNIRIVCNNTLQAALRGLSNKVSIPHRMGAKERLAEAYKVMNIHSKYTDEVSLYFNKMAETKIDDEILKKYILDVMKNDKKEEVEPAEEGKEKEEEYSTRLMNQVSDIYNFALSHPTQNTDAARGTLWGAYNSISGYYNYKTYNGRYEKETNKMIVSPEEQRFYNQMFGTGAVKISKAFQKALQLI